MDRIRKMIALIICAMLMLPACSGTPAPQASPAWTPRLVDGATASATAGADPSVPTETYEPPPAQTMGEFTLVDIVDGSTPEASNYFTILEKLLRSKGWKVRIYGVDLIYDDNGRPQYEQLIKQLSGANSPPDGYILEAGAAAKLLDEGWVQDLASILPDTAPLYFSRYQKQFTGQIAAMPLYAITRMGGVSTLYLKKDFVERHDPHIQTTADLFDLLESGANNQIRVISMFSLLDDWAAERGYYSLGSYGGPWAFYAGFEDPLCTPVPLEKIPGLKDFTDRCRRLIAEKHIAMGESEEQDAQQGMDVIGNYGFLAYYDLASKGETGKDYVGFPLVYSGKPSLPEDEPFALYELAVAAASTKGAEIAKFLDWIVSSQENYDLVNYRKLGEDYRILGGLLEPLLKGNPISASDWYREDIVIGYRSDPRIFFDSRFARPTIYYPSNWEELKLAEPVNVPPIWKIKKLRTPDCYSLFENVSAENTEALERRYALISQLFTNEEGNPSTNAEYEQVFTGLAAMADDTQAIVTAYARRIQELMDEQAKQ
jgi:ABC-type glycerol-3-phosphate transport system substrate-binding protein